MSELAHIPVSALLQEALSRPGEMIDERGYLSKEAFGLADLLGIRVCVDGAPVRRNQDGDPELMAINRMTGPYAGKLCLVGGGVGRVNAEGVWLPESIGEAAKRHFDSDLGMGIEPVTSWEQPQLVAQDMRPVDGEVREGFLPNPNSRHLIAARYLVRITEGADAPVFGSTAHGGQEAQGVTWFTEDDMPDDDMFGYNHGDTYRKLFAAADELADRIA